MESLARRITPLTVVPDIAPVVRQYYDLGFEAVETGTPGCVGMRAGDSHVILASVDHMACDFGSATAASLVGRTILYIYVQSVEAAKAHLSLPVIVLGQVATRGGTLEALIEQDGQYLILAEKT